MSSEKKIIRTTREEWSEETEKKETKKNKGFFNGMID
jgi:hypothetical protein